MRFGERNWIKYLPPYSTLFNDILNLDQDIERVCIPNGRDGRPTGEGFVIFKTQEAYDLALKKDRENMGSR